MYNASLPNRYLDPITLSGGRNEKEAEEETGKTQKTKGVISYQNFTRAGIVMCVYDELRKNGQKHSLAVSETIEFTTQHYPNKRVSETAVRRNLGEFRPEKVTPHFSSSVLRSLKRN